MSLKKSVQKEVRKRAQETVMKLMADERTRPIVAKAMQTYMEGRQRVDEVRDQAVERMGLVTQKEFNAIKSRLKKLERQLDQIAAKLDAAESKLKA